MSTLARFSLEEYEHMVEVGAFAGPFRKRVELIRGEIVEMTPIGTEHAYCVALLDEWSHKVVPSDKAMIRCQNPIRLPLVDSEPEPDIVWVTRKDYSKKHPGPKDTLLVIEVAESSLEDDRTTKLVDYANSGIPEYWIVNLLDLQIEVYRHPHEFGYS